MRVVVTGAAGFIGSHLSERLAAEGWEVRGVDAFTPYYDPVEKEEHLAGLASEPRFDLVRADLVRADLAAVLAGAPLVVHLAAQPGVRASFGQGFDRYVHDNVLATQRVLESAREAGCRRVVYASSSSVYGDADSYPCTEDAAQRPRSPYGVTKSTCERLADVYRSSGTSVVGLRYFTVYGPRQRPDMAIRRVCEAVAGGPAFALNGDGSQSRDFTYVDDAVDATVRALVAPDPAAALNVGGGQEATMAAVIDQVGRLAGNPVPVRRVGDQVGDVRRTGASTLLAREQLGWAPRTALADGLRAELDWVLARRRGRVEAGARSLAVGVPS